ncbi:MAG: OmpA family protein [Nitrospirota bacterium]
MKKGFQLFLTVLVGCSFLLLSGCPKKIVPIRKITNITRRVPTKVVPKEPLDLVIPEEPSSLPLQEEEIASVAKVEESEIPASDSGINEAETKKTILKDIFFDLDQWTIKVEEMAILEENVKWMNKNLAAKIIVNGYGDSRGTNEYNLILGEKRASVVKDAMVTLGIKPSRLTVVSYGEERPFCVEEDDSCYKQNRRVQHRVE